MARWEDIHPPPHFFTATIGKEICGGEEDGGKDDVFSRRSLMVPQVNLFFLGHNLVFFGGCPRKRSTVGGTLFAGRL